MRQQHKQGNKALKLLIKVAVIMALYAIGFVLFMLLIWRRGQNRPPHTDEAVTALMQQEIDAVYTGHTESEVNNE